MLKAPFYCRRCTAQGIELVIKMPKDGHLFTAWCELCRMVTQHRFGKLRNPDD